MDCLRFSVWNADTLGLYLTTMISSLSWAIEEVFDIGHEDLHRSPSEEVTLPQNEAVKRPIDKPKNCERRPNQGKDTYITPNVKATATRSALFRVMVPRRLRAARRIFSRGRRRFSRIPNGTVRLHGQRRR
jgi:hypothetical protein